MIVPTDISPIDYQKETNEFIFVTAEFILRVNYQSKYIQLETPNKLAFMRSFDFIKKPTEEFETIEFGVVEWIRSAIAWDKKKSKPKDRSKPYSFQVEGITYSGTFNPRTNNITIRLPEKTIVCKRDSITTDFPEVQYMEHGQLVTKITTNIISKIQRSKNEVKTKHNQNLPLEFKPETITAGENTYKFAYLIDRDLALLMIPAREIQANLLLIETDAPELSELHKGMLYDLLRSIVYEKSSSN